MIDNACALCVDECPYLENAGKCPAVAAAAEDQDGRD